MAAFPSLKDWTQQFIKHKDVFERKLVKVIESATGFSVHRKDGIQAWHLFEQFKVPPASKDQVTVVCLSTPGNVRAVVAAWKSLILFPRLTILFVNLELGEKWLLNPKVHDMIADPTTLEAGLMNLMNAANGVVDDAPKRGRKPKLFEESEEGEGDEESER